MRYPRLASVRGSLWLPLAPSGPRRKRCRIFADTTARCRSFRSEFNFRRRESHLMHAHAATWRTDG